MTPSLQIITADHMRTARGRVLLAQWLSVVLALAILGAFPVSLIYWKGVHPAFYGLVATFVATLIVRGALRRHELEKLVAYYAQRRELLCPKCYEPVTESVDGRSRCDDCRQAWRSDALLEFLQHPLKASPPQPIGKAR